MHQLLKENKQKDSMKTSTYRLSDKEYQMLADHAKRTEQSINNALRDILRKHFSYLEMVESTEENNLQGK